jgi:hypothetical protein
MIDRCPNCGYSLEGLPGRHVCPECGLEYEKDAVVFKEPRWGWKALAIANGLLALLGIALCVWRSRPSVFIWIPLGCGVIAACWVWKLSRRKHVVLVSRSTIRIMGKTPGAVVYRMEDVGQISWSFLSGDIHIKRPDGSELTTIKRRFLASHLQAWRMVKIVRRYAQLARDTPLA